MIPALLLVLVLAPQDPLKDLRSKDPAVRLAAVGTLARDGHDKASKALVGALDDRDWAVAEAAALALARAGDERAVEPLVELALDGPIERLRVAAADSLAVLDPQAAGRALAKAAGGKQGVRALEAIARMGPVADEGATAAAVEKALRSKELDLRRAAARAVPVVSAPGRAEALATALVDPDLAVRCAALEAVAAYPDAEHLEVLTAELARAEQVDVVERRLVRAAAAAGLAGGVGELESVLARLREVGASEVAARRMQLALAVGLGSAGGGGPELVELLEGELALCLEHPAPEVRAAALHAGLQLGSGAVLERAVDLALEDPSPRVRRAALQALVAGHVEGRAPRVEADVALAPILGGGAPPVIEVAALAADLLGADPDAGVRELAAVSLGTLAGEGTLAALAAALDDEHWAVATCAAVSLGRAADGSAAPVLEALLDHPDWRRRGAAVVGLTELNGPEAVPGVVRALADEEPAVRRSAWSWLRRIAREDLPLERDPWERWWSISPERARFVDAEAERRRREKYGYAAKSNADLFATVFQELDVIVLESRGDHIQNLLERLDIAFRPTAAARHVEDALHPSGVYVSNCTGEVEPADLERLQWFVKTGGYLFGSCWSLTHTIGEIAPAVARKLETDGEVLDTVEAAPAAPGSPWLAGVFPPHVRPVYELQGSHLIVVELPERAEVLIDSPACAARWGGGNLAVWFRDGHGLILDSANHFDLQGLANATHLKRDVERQAFAVDRLGLSLEDLRAVQDERWWGSNGKAAREVPDTSAFRFLTNFVRHKRLNE